MENHLYPMLLSYSTRDYIWGGTRLIEKYGKSAPRLPLAETWELSVRPDAMSRILSGPCRGLELGEYIRQYGKNTVAAGFEGDRFPLLIKFIDARDKLSVQVHPDDDYAGKNENDSGKTEMWYVVEAKPGASIVYGLKDGVGRGDFKAAVGRGDYDSVMNYVPVAAGDCFFIPAGMLHAIGAGILIAEIQQNSDLTYRVYDYKRIGTDGKERPLHVEKALDVVRPFSPSELDRLRFLRGMPPITPNVETLANCARFCVQNCGNGAADAFVNIDASSSFAALLFTEGSSVVSGGEERLAAKAGDCVFVPAGTGECLVHGDARFLCASL